MKKGMGKTALIKKADKLWALAVKKRAKDKCELCPKRKNLNSHHIFSRSNARMRHNLDNGVCLCVSHHVWGQFSAHKSPVEFIERMKEKRGAEWYANLRRSWIESRKKGSLTVLSYGLTVCALEESLRLL